MKIAVKNLRAQAAVCLKMHKDIINSIDRAEEALSNMRARAARLQMEREELALAADKLEKEEETSTCLKS